MRVRSWVVFTVVVVIAAVVIFSSVYVVDESEYALVLQFGRVTSTVTEPGLYLKTPLVQTVVFVDRRLREWDGEPSNLLTVEKQKIEVNTFARWRVTDPKRFYEALRTENAGQGVLDGQIDASVKNVVSTYPFMEVLRNTRRKLKYTTEELEKAEEERNVVIEVGRERIVREILDQARKDLEEKYGFTVVDLGIKHINYVQDVIPKIHERMRSERKRVANLFESEGRELEARILGDMAKELEQIESEAAKRATIIRGDADAQALTIYAEAYGKDPDFYAFVRSLDALRKTVNGKTRLVIGLDNPLFRYLKELGAGKK